MASWFTADLHLNHENIIRHCNRPFRTSQEMDGHYIASLREHVAAEDDLWILGDFAFARNAGDRDRVCHLFDQIPGRRHLVRGNHDHKATLRLDWTSVSDIAEIEEEGQRLVLCHYPMTTWNRARYGAIQLFGHVHDALAGFRGSVNVGVDQWCHRPVRLEEIVARSRELPVNPLYSDTR